MVSIVKSFFVEDALRKLVDAMLELELWDHEEIIRLSGFFQLFASTQYHTLALSILVDK